MAVPDADGEDAAEEVQVLAPLHVLDEHSLAGLEGQGLLVVGADVGEQQLLLLAADEFVRPFHPLRSRQMTALHVARSARRRGRWPADRQAGPAQRSPEDQLAGAARL